MADGFRGLVAGPYPLGDDPMQAPGEQAQQPLPTGRLPAAAAVGLHPVAMLGPSGPGAALALVALALLLLVAGTASTRHDLAAQSVLVLAVGVGLLLVLCPPGLSLPKRTLLLGFLLLCSWLGQWVLSTLWHALRRPSMLPEPGSGVQALLLAAAVLGCIAAVRLCETAYTYLAVRDSPVPTSRHSIVHHRCHVCVPTGYNCSATYRSCFRGLKHASSR